MQGIFTICAKQYHINNIFLRVQNRKCLEHGANIISALEDNASY